MRRLLFVSIIGICLITIDSFSIIINVPGDYLTIQEAVDNCLSGDEIRVAPGIYGPVYADSLSDIKIIGAGIVPPSVTVIDVDDSTRGIEIHRSTKIIIQGFEIRDCWQECLHFLDCNEVYILDNYLHDCNDNLGNGLAITRCNDVLIKRNVIVENTEVSVYIDAFYSSDSTSKNIQVINNTIGYTGTGSWGADGFTLSWSDTGFVYVNNINVFNSDYGLHYKFGPQTSLSELSYNCHYGNLFGPWGGCYVDSTNLNLDPLFTYGVGIYAYFLADYSPCIDAGDPARQDPDSTRSDIGALYYDQGTPGELDIELMPRFSPILLPSEGGNFGYAVSINNTSASQNYFDAWLKLKSPDGTLSDPIAVRTGLYLHYNGMIFVDEMVLDVPASAMAGIHYLIGYVGSVAENYVVDADSILFEKEEIGDYTDYGSGIWSLSGWGETEYFRIGNSAPTAFKLELEAAPNPFNPITNIHYSLPADGYAKVTVFNIMGREISTLFEGNATAGVNDVRWNAWNQASGVYIVRLEYDSNYAFKRVFLIK